MAKGKKKTEKIEREFTIGLQKTYDIPKPRRANKAMATLKDFAYKHFRTKRKDVLISNQVNETIWEKGRENPPRKIEVKIVFTEGKANIFLKKEKVKIQKEEKKEEKKAEKKTKEEKQAEEEKERKKEEKKLAEKSAEKAAMKRRKE